MDIVTDLTARAVSFISLLQDMSYSQDPRLKSKQLEDVILLGPPEDFEAQLIRALQLDDSPEDKNKTSLSITSKRFRERAAEIRRINGCPLLEEEEEAWINQAKLLLDWLQNNKESLNQRLAFSRMKPDSVKKKPVLPCGANNLKTAEELRIKQEIKPVEADRHRDPYPAPQQWRMAIQYILYNSPTQRLSLVQALDFLPVLLVLAQYGEGPTLAQQEELRIKISGEDRIVADLLKNDKLLRETLVGKNVPLPFTMVFQAELEEVLERREKGKKKSKNGSQDPYQQAAEMNLIGLALSGGGIRSATFNLGILQGLAKAEYLPRFDYLSTVSGGGYIGTWFAAWVKRDGFLLKVQDRLNPEKSVDPRGEEVRPIRWLRMFSNYLAPNSSIMSSDSWTMGMTWLRNTLLNQTIILLMLCTTLCIGFLIFLIWKGKQPPPLEKLVLIDTSVIFGVLSGLLIIGGGLAGWGMRTFHRQRSSLEAESNRPFEKWLTIALLILGWLTAFLGSSWLYLSSSIISDWFYISSNFTDWLNPSFNIFKSTSNCPISFGDKFLYLLPITLVGAVSLYLVAWLGKYGDCLPRDESYAKVVLYISPLLSALFGAVLLVLAWSWIEYFYIRPINSIPWNTDFSKNCTWSDLVNTKGFNERVAFILGTPLILEVLSLTVIMRMALLGKYFPDNRREWWGKMGGLLHLCILSWLLISTTGLLGDKLVELAQVHLPAATTIWTALVGLAVRSAYTSNGPVRDGAPKSTFQKGKEFLILIGPYLFIVGVLILAANIVAWVLKFDWFGLMSPMTNETLFLRTSLLIVILGLLTIFLAWRVGVNEFSMHHFYRNRLMRGYLAATRRNFERKSTANSFTGFDEKDDLKLCLLRTEKGYDGPYPIINTTLNASQVTDLDRRDRQGESFVFTPLYCGFDISRNRAMPIKIKTEKSNEYAFRPTEEYAYRAQEGVQLSEVSENSNLGGPTVSTAMAISGAAANPNQGAHSSPVTAFLMTVFNARLGWWMGNPLGDNWQESDPKSGLVYLFYDLIGKTDTRRDFVCLSDGGHFDNMGIYELVRRRVRLIILGDAEQDALFNCEGLANAIRRCRVDFGVEIDIDISPITNRDDKTKYSDCHYAIGTILYPDDPEDKPSGRLLYLKSSLTGDETVDIREYSKGNPDFPHQSTGDQFFSEDQFESYRKLGLHVMESALKSPLVQKNLHFPIFQKNEITIEIAISEFPKYIWEKLLKVYRR